MKEKREAGNGAMEGGSRDEGEGVEAEGGSNKVIKKRLHS